MIVGVCFHDFDCCFLSFLYIFLREKCIPWCHHPMLDVTFLKGKEICYSYIVANTCS